MISKLATLTNYHDNEKINAAEGLETGLAIRVVSHTYFLAFIS